MTTVPPQRHIETAISAVICALLLVWLSSCAVVAKAQIMDEEMGWMLDAVTRPVASGAVATGWTDPNTYTGLWEFETTNTVATLDTSGNAYHATNRPNVATGPRWDIAGTNQYARVEHSYFFDGGFGSDDFFLVGSSATPFSFYNSGEKAGTFSAWVKSAGVGMFVGGKDDGTTREWFLYYQGDNKVLFRIYDDGLSAYIQRLSSNAVTISSWVMLTATYDGSSSQNGMHIYTNGIEIGSAPVLSGTYTVSTNTTQPVRLGVRGDGVATWAGSMDNVFFIQGTALSEASLQTMAANTHPTNNVRVRP